MDYRRVQLAGGCYFFTLVLAQRGSDLLKRHINVLRGVFKTAQRLGYKCVGWR